MATQNESIADAISNLSIRGSSEHFFIQRERSKANLFNEVIRVEQGGNQFYSTIRSPVSAGGFPIGIWEAPAEQQSLKALAKRLYGCRIWEISDEPLVSGGEVHALRIEIDRHRVGIVIRGGSPILMKISPLDVELRRIANTLIASKNGRSLRCELRLSQPLGGWVNAQIILINDGNKSCILQNPLATGISDLDFLRIEVGPPPISQPGVTCEGIRYEPLAMPESRDFAPPWDKEEFVLDAGQRIAYPDQLPINASKYKRYFIRAAYSHYGNSAVRDIPIIRGCVFSEEIQL
jgi:hypothetical protein